MSDRIRIRSVELLSDGWTRLKKVVLDYRRREGGLETQTREVYERGEAATVLPYDPDRGTVLLVRQFRLPVYLASGAETMLEACAGVLDEDEDAETCIRREAEEEMGCRLRNLKRLCAAYTIPGCVTEKVTFFTARYSPADRISAGGGHPGEGEDIEVVEMGLGDAFAATRDGRIIDAKTIVLVQALMLEESGVRAAD
ncbi:MAG: GDP-mannose pyrophosphatase [Rhizobiales bacterium 65-79]|jgi:nudix-type nucleoside diphosphatase (YffH/AdpP family)|nr:NUDIX domain-containing protein [Hyphomicrobiales bacterium]OJU03135.1 MAG: GDP-mannose pyrophosphatase [Rhizobiales bacterium 65-79]